MILLSVAVCTFCNAGSRLQADEATSKHVVESIERAKGFLLKAQSANGSWSASEMGAATVGGSNPTGVTSLALLALLNAGVPSSDPGVQRALEWLRRQEPEHTYSVSLMIQALAAAKEGGRDALLVATLVRRLEEKQIKKGADAGSWGYGAGPRGDESGDRSNTQFAVLALRDAQEMGIAVDIETWRRARAHWIASQNADGGWGYDNHNRLFGGQSYGSMTVAGIASLVITEAMLKAERKELKPDGTPICCDGGQRDEALERACLWLGERFQVRGNPMPGNSPWGNFWLYYMYGLERAGRFSGRRFFSNKLGQRHDWYREGADVLVERQNPLTGSWKGNGVGEEDAVIATSYALIFLSKGLAPVLINKLQHGPRGANGNETVGTDWNQHKDDARNLTQLLSNRPKWPRLLNWQTVDISQAGVGDLLQAPIAFISGSDAPQFTPEDVALLKEFILQGGFVFAVRNCNSDAFDEGFRDLVRRMYPPDEAQLKKLAGDHPVFRSEFNLLDDKGEPTVELWGVDVGCRTGLIYAPDDLSCLWDKWTTFEIPGRPKELLALIDRATRAGVNVVAYVTGREIFNKLQQREQVLVGAGTDRIERDVLQISKLQYRGDWDAAPQALRNLLIALSRTAGLAVSTKQRDVRAIDPNLFRYPIAFMHGRYDFALPKNEQDRLRDYILRGGVLFSDACCGMPQYDRSFRKLMKELFPDNPLKRIPVEHELFSEKIGHDLRKVKRRERDADRPDAALSVSVREVEPFLEGIEINGRFVVIYSKYDISCALERQASVACSGYMREDAIRIATNVVLYALLQ